MESSNPFVTIGHRGPRYFCDRKRETQKLLSWVENGSNITLIASAAFLRKCALGEWLKRYAVSAAH